MTGRNVIAWLAAGAVLVACGDQESDASSDTTRTLLSQPRAADVSTEIDPSRLPSPDEPLDIDMLGINLGSVEAPVKVVEFADFGCGFCRRFQLETFPTLRAEFIETGMVEWKFMPFVSGMFENSQVVTEAAECALGQSPRLFGAFTDLLWARQSEWKQSDDPAGVARAWMGQLGGDLEAYETCLADGPRLRRVEGATQLAAELGVRSTPTFWILGVGPVQGALPVDAFRQIFTTAHEELSAAADRPGDPGA